MVGEINQDTKSFATGALAQESVAQGDHERDANGVDGNPRRTIETPLERRPFCQSYRRTAWRGYAKRGDRKGASARSLLQALPHQARHAQRLDRRRADLPLADRASARGRLPLLREASRSAKRRVGKEGVIKG